MAIISGHLQYGLLNHSQSAGHILRLYRDTRRGYNASDGLSAAISCTYPEAIDQVKVGHRIFIDDGKIEELVRSSNEQYLELEGW
ncbi:MAG: hypothetical protein WA364_21600 [Candidatus Nitrosopolaris sp.]